MGWLSYARDGAVAEIEDLELAHLQAAMRRCFRAGVGFVLTIRRRGEAGEAVVLWMHPTIPIGCAFSDGELRALDLGWVARMTREAMSEGGLSATAASLRVSR